MTEKTIQQDIAGDNNRNAGNDYTEINLTIINIKVEVSNTYVFSPKQKLRDFEEEAQFYERFKFDASADQCRQVLQIKQQFGLTDLTIRLLKRSGALSVMIGKPVKLHADRISYIVTVLLMALCISDATLFASVTLMRGNNLLLNTFVVSLLATICALFFCYMYKYTIKPVNILRSYGIRLGDTFTLPAQ